MKKTAISHAIGAAVGTALLLTAPSAFAADINDSNFYTFTQANITAISAGTVVGTLTATNTSKSFEKTLQAAGEDGICFDDGLDTSPPDSKGRVAISIKPDSGKVILDTDVLSTTFCRLNKAVTTTASGTECQTSAAVSAADAPYEVLIATKSCGTSSQQTTVNLTADSFKDNLKAVNADGTQNNNYDIRLIDGKLKVVALNANGGDFYVAGVAAGTGLGVDMQQPRKDAAAVTAPPPAAPSYSALISTIYLDTVNNGKTLGTINNHNSNLTYAVTPSDALKITGNQIQILDKSKLSVGTLTLRLTASNGSVSPATTNTINVLATAPQSNCNEGTEILSTTGPSGPLMWEVKSPDSGRNSVHGKDHVYTWRNNNASQNEGAPGSLGNTVTCNFSLFPERCNTITFVAAVNDASYCGFSDWRLPTRAELQYLRSLHRNGTVSLNDLNTSGRRTALFWTSESGKASKHEAIEAYVVDFGTADIQLSDKVNQESIRLVRSR